MDSQTNPDNAAQSTKLQSADTDSSNDLPISLRKGDCIGRYRIEALLGTGGFGVVYRAVDSLLNRDVAIKVPRPKYAQSDEFVEHYLSEARLTARLDHANIIPIFDSGRDDKVKCFFVTKYVTGDTLSAARRASRLDFLEIARICRDVATALHYAHGLGIIHRDVKTGNIILDESRRPYLIDFGLAIDNESFGKASGYAGTPAFMSPEQARGEGHFVDGRTDIYSLGVVLYLLTTGCMPTRGSSDEEILRSITTYDPKPPRQIDDNIPRELERICLKAIANRVSDRYTTAKDFAEDLDCFLNEAQSDSHGSSGSGAALEDSERPPTRFSGHSSKRRELVVPKGLRAFDEGDAEFFLSLLPGPIDRLGLPERVRFLKKFVEESRVDCVQPIGVLYGPSGCGKSSIIRAGLIPRLSDDVCPIVIEATGEGTERTILRTLKRLDPALENTRSLVESFAMIRLGRTNLKGRKVVVILDQFEQWLNTRTDYARSELVAAMRQCDGVRLQCILGVRDDFWVSVSRLLREVEVKIQEGENAALVDVFDLSHAKKVLLAIGQAYERLPRRGVELSQEQESFLERAVDELSERRRVTPVRIAVFAEMMKDKEWVVKNLEGAGGSEGVGVAFLNDTFNLPESPTRRKRHRVGAQRVLAKLVPTSGADLKGSQCSATELRQASGYPDEAEFADLMTLLDKELRLLTPVEQPTDPNVDSHSEIGSNEPAFRLTHDFLVSPLRTWLAQGRRQTIAGRAMLRLEETAGFWSMHRDKKLLPTWWEWLFIRLFVPAKKWSKSQCEMMRTAGRLLGWRLLLALTVTTVGVLLASTQLRRMNRDLAIRRLIAATVKAIPESIDELRGYGDGGLLKVREQIEVASSPELSEEQFRLRIANSAISGEADPILEKALLERDPDTIRVAGEMVGNLSSSPQNYFWEVVESNEHSSQQRLRAACLVAIHSPPDSRWEKVAPDIVATLLDEPLVRAERWAEILEPISEPMLNSVCVAIPSESSVVRRNRLMVMARLFSDGNKDSLGVLRDIASRAKPSDDLELVRQSALASAALAELGDWPNAKSVLQQQPDSTLRTETIAAIEAAEIPIADLLDILDESPVEKASPGVRAGLLACLGDQASRRLSPEQSQRLVALLKSVLADTNESAEAKSVCRWLARRLGLPVQTDGVETSYMISLSVSAEQARSEESTPWRFEIAAYPVTVKEFQKFRPNHDYNDDTATDLDCPVNNVTWFDAVAYCNYLSQQAGLDRDQWCYVPNENGEYELGMEIPLDIHQRRGFRLPTTFEWAVACRSDKSTQWSWGRSKSLSHRYAWSLRNAGFRTHPVGELLPNEFGLFDSQGQVWEWSHDTPNPSGSVVVSNENRFLCGGTFLNDIDSISWESKVDNPPHHRTGADSFRVVKRVFD